MCDPLQPTSEAYVETSKAMYSPQYATDLVQLLANLAVVKLSSKDPARDWILSFIV